MSSQVAVAVSVPQSSAALTQALLTNSVASGAMQNTLAANGVKERVSPAGAL